jgi:hypothetical protein
MASHRSLSCNLNLKKDADIVHFVNKKNSVGIRDASIVKEAVKFYMKYYDNIEELIYTHNALVASSLDVGREIAIQQELGDETVDIIKDDIINSEELIAKDTAIANLRAMINRK